MASYYHHPTASVGHMAQIGEGALIGPDCHIGARAIIGAGANITGAVTIPDGLTIRPGLTIASDADVSRVVDRVALAARWDSLPDWIRGPYKPQYDAANALLDSGDDAGAAALIEYAPAMPDFSDAQTATFATVKAEFAAAIAALS